MKDQAIKTKIKNSKKNHIRKKSKIMKKQENPNLNIQKYKSKDIIKWTKKLKNQVEIKTSETEIKKSENQYKTQEIAYGIKNQT